MNNANKPAYPLEAHGFDTGITVEYHDKQGGLTKRERFAIAAMQGILSKQAGAGDQLGDLTNRNMDKIAEASTHFADALLKELEETNE